MIVGLTGGIGSGKTTVARFFEELGIPIYISDTEAKRLMSVSPEIRREIIELLGTDAYTSEGLNRKYIADKVFKDKQLLEKLNAIVHPRVATNFANWYKQQDSPYVIKEAAILIETGAYKQLDKIVLVTANLEQRIHRIINRDKVSRDDVLQRIRNQMSDQEKIPYADYIIENDRDEPLTEKVEELHHDIIKLTL